MLESETIYTDQFVNSDQTSCPNIDYSIVDDTGSAIPATVNNMISLDGSSKKIKINELNYDGSTLNLQLKAVTGFGVPVYQPISIIPRIATTYCSNIKSEATGRCFPDDVINFFNWSPKNDPQGCLEKSQSDSRCNTNGPI